MKSGARFRDDKGKRVLGDLSAILARDFPTTFVNSGREYENERHLSTNGGYRAAD